MRMAFHQRRPVRAFTLMEVMIAMAIFFVAIFAILELTSRSLSLARSLQRNYADPALLAAEMSTLPELEEGSESGDFGEAFPEASWQSEVYEVYSNGLFQADFLVTERVDGKLVQSEMSILLFRPGSSTGTARGSR